MGRVEIGVATLGIHQLVEDQEQAVGVDRAGVEVVVAVLRIVEVEAAELAELDQAGDDLDRERELRLIAASAGDAEMDELEFFAADLADGPASRPA